MKSGAPESEIDNARTKYEKYISSKTKYNDLMREAEKYKNEPLKYFIKFNEAESSKLKSLEESLLTLQQQNKLLELKQQTLISGMKPEQLLKADEEFSNLSSVQQNKVIKKLQEVTKRDTSKRGEIVSKFLKLNPEEKKAFIDSEITPQFPVKVKGKKQQFEVLINKAEVDNALAVQRYSSPEEKVFVMDHIFNDEFNSLKELNKSIDYYKKEYNEQRPNKTDIYFKQANEEQHQNDLVASAISADTSNVARDVAIDDSIPHIDVAEDAPLIANVAKVLQDTDELTQEEAQADAHDAVSGANAEAYLTYTPEPAQPAEAQSAEAPPDEAQSAEAPPDEAQSAEAPSDEAQSAEAQSAEAQSAKVVYDDINGMTKKELKQYILDNFNKEDKGNISSFSIYQLRSKIRQLRAEGKEKPREEGKPKPKGKKGKSTSGKGFKPLLSYPYNLVAGALSKHIDRVRTNRFKAKINAHAILKNVDNEEYRKNMTKHILNGGSIRGWLGWK